MDILEVNKTLWHVRIWHLHPNLTSTCLQLYKTTALLIHTGTVPNNSYGFRAELVHRWLFLEYGWHPWRHHNVNATSTNTRIFQVVDVSSSHKLLKIKRILSFFMIIIGEYQAEIQKISPDVRSTEGDNPPVDLHWFFEISISAFISNWDENSVIK